ncbi:D-3-phosphoglycerate dehydrogenase, partial [Haematococcus lacustris]
VGSEVGRRAKGLGLNVVAYDPYASAEKAAALGVRLVSFDEALQTADFFSLHMPLLPTTKNLFGAEAFAKIKKGARIINVARGGVIDEEGVSIEVVEAVVDALQGKLSANAVNAPMVPQEVLKELRPYIALAEGLGKAAVSLVKDSGFTDVSITYSSPRGDDLDTRLLRANVLKGVLEGTTTAMVNLVNADLLAKNRGIKISEVTVRGEGSEVLSSMSVALGTANTRFSAA